MQWTEDRIEELRELARHYTTTQIADLMNCTRNVIVGKCHRLGIKPKPVDPQQPGPPKPPKQLSAVERATVERIIREKLALPRETLPPEKKGQFTLIELGNNDCRWPYGDRDFTFCGMPTIEGSPYCPTHTKKSRQRFNK